MSDKIERVAKALAEHDGCNWDTCLKAPGQRRAGMYRSMARAAIEVSEYEEPYVPNENTVRIPIKVWRRLNRGEPIE